MKRFHYSLCRREAAEWMIDMRLSCIPPHGKARFSFVALTLYCWLLLSFQALSERIGLTLLFALALGVLSLIFTALLFRLFAAPLRAFVPSGSPERAHIWGLAIGGVTALVLLVCLAGNYPGGLFSDCCWQLRQATGVEGYNDWHPVLHTLLFFTLPLKLGDSLRVMVLWQILLFSGAFGYLGYVLCRRSCPKLFVAVICLYVWLDPYIGKYLMYPMKDCGLTIFAMLLLAQYIQTVCSGGEWLSRRRNAVAFAVTAVLCLFMRHNAVLLVAPLTALALFVYLRDGKRRALILVLMALGFAAVKLLYAGLDVQKPDKRVLETIGLPVTVWCNVMQNCPEALPEDTREVMYKIATKEVYENEYSDCFNSIKWNWHSDLVFVDSLSYAQVAKYTWQCFRYAPRESFEAVAVLTAQVWSVEKEPAPGAVAILDNPLGAYSKPFPAFRQFVYQLWDFLDHGLGSVLFGSVGLELLVLVAAGLLLLAADRMSVLHILPFLCYDFATMLLLAGFDHRFFMYKLPLWLPLVFLMTADRGTFAGSKAARAARKALVNAPEKGDNT